MGTYLPQTHQQSVIILIEAEFLEISTVHQHVEFMFNKISNTRYGYLIKLSVSSISGYLTSKISSL